MIEPPRTFAPILVDDDGTVPNGGLFADRTQYPVVIVCGDSADRHVVRDYELRLRHEIASAIRVSPDMLGETSLDHRMAEIEATIERKRALLSRMIDGQLLDAFGSAATAAREAGRAFARIKHFLVAEPLSRRRRRRLRGRAKGRR